jgi:hypothetical protein
MPSWVRQEIKLHVMHIREPAHRSGGPRRGLSLNCTATLSLNEYSIANAALILEVAVSTV